jgi:hypothetical protein
MFRLTDPCEIENRKNPIDHNHPIEHTMNGNMTASVKSPTFRGFSTGPSGTEPTSAIVPTKYAPHIKTKICQCFARRKKPVIPFTISPVLRFSPI